MLELVDERKADRGLALVWLREALAGNRHFFKMLLDRTEGALHFGDPELVVADADGMPVDADVAERILLAAAPEMIPDFEDEE